MPKPSGAIGALVVVANIAAVIFCGLTFLPTAANTWLMKASLVASAGASSSAVAKGAFLIAILGYIGFYYLRNLFIGRRVVEELEKYKTLTDCVRSDRRSYLSLLPKDLWESISTYGRMNELNRAKVWVKENRTSIRQNLEYLKQPSTHTPVGTALVVMAGVLLFLAATRYTHMLLAAIFRVLTGLLFKV